ncbi:hypothetical protein BC827DRAFT_1154757 [Russula dissimulans]|nr:hypothetical protein BC827DRAFT_1154757 [Russula dissimulans]
MGTPRLQKRAHLGVNQAVGQSNGGPDGLAIGVEVEITTKRNPRGPRLCTRFAACYRETAQIIHDPQPSLLTVRYQGLPEGRREAQQKMRNEVDEDSVAKNVGTGRTEAGRGGEKARWVHAYRPTPVTTTTTQHWRLQGSGRVVSDPEKRTNKRLVNLWLNGDKGPVIRRPIDRAEWSRLSLGAGVNSRGPCGHLDKGEFDRRQPVALIALRFQFYSSMIAATWNRSEIDYKARGVLCRF